MKRVRSILRGCWKPSKETRQDELELLGTFEEAPPKAVASLQVTLIASGSYDDTPPRITVTDDDQGDTSVEVTPKTKNQLERTASLDDSEDDMPAESKPTQDSVTPTLSSSLVLTELVSTVASPRALPTTIALSRPPTMDSFQGSLESMDSLDESYWDPGDDASQTPQHVDDSELFEEHVRFLKVQTKPTKIEVVYKSPDRQAPDEQTI